MKSIAAISTQHLRQEAQRLGFDFVGIAKARRLDEEEKQLETWLNRGYQGKMQYLENHFEKRLDPRKLVPDAKSVVMLTYNYFTAKKQTDPEAPKIAKYAYGKDYHHIIKPKLKSLLQSLQETVGEVEGRCFVDSAPVMERQWAALAGVGWTAKNTLLLHPKQGSYFFLATLIIDLELLYDHPIKDYCGTCTRCIDACPTNAIAPSGYLLDASKCISYLTIELKDEIPDHFRGQMDNWMFGCDVCQEVCPWNRFAKPHQEEQFEPHPELLDKSKAEWEELTQEVFNTLFRKSAVKRTKYAGLKRNLQFIRQSSYE